MTTSNLQTNRPSSKAAKPYKGVAMEGVIATWYAKITQNDSQRHKVMAAQVAKEIVAGSRVLEVAPGPGYFCVELARLGDYQITGLDISKSFVEIAQKNAANAGFKIEFRQGDAANMPFADETFDFIFCQAAFKNFTEPVKAIGEMHRVLKPGGKALIVDLQRDAPREMINQEVNRMGLGRINTLITRWTFDHMLLKTAYTVDQMKAFVSQTPFRKCEINVEGVGFGARLEK